MITTFKDREVEIDGLDIPSGGPDYWCDAFIESAYYTDTLVELTDDEKEELFAEQGYELVVEYMY